MCLLSHPASEIFFLLAFLGMYGKKGMFTLELCSWFLEIPNEPIYYSVNF